MTLFPKVQGRQLPHHEHSRADPERPGLPLRGRSCHRRALQRHQGDDGALQRERGVPRLNPRVPRPGRPGSLPGGQGPGQVRRGGFREQPHHRASRREDSRQEVRGRHWLKWELRIRILSDPALLSSVRILTFSNKDKKNGTPVLASGNTLKTSILVLNSFQKFKIYNKFVRKNWFYFV